VDFAVRARAFAVDAYGSSKELEHPTEVATLVGADDRELWVAALLHDLVEDTATEIEAIEAQFGARVAAIVSAMTEDSSIADYRERKEEHRQRARDAGRDVALVFVADKLSNARRMRRGQKEPEQRKLDHYAATLATMRTAYPDLPLLDELEGELNARKPAARA
jgi:GTP diphosphokinase / guanosine-3',5'-bis(diphosphate) 3'-diphosphatase